MLTIRNKRDEMYKVTAPNGEIYKIIENIDCDTAIYIDIKEKAHRERIFKVPPL